MKAFFLIGGLACMLGDAGCGPCEGFGQPAEGTCECDDGMVLDQSACPACDDVRPQDLGLLEDQRAPGRVNRLCKQEFSFQLRDNASLALVLADASGTVNLEISDDNGTSQGPVTATSTRDGALSLPLPAGSYSISVATPSESSVSFELQLNAKTYAPEETRPEPGDNKDDAQDVGKLEEVASFGGYVGPSDDEDYYGFELTENATVTLAAAEVQGRVWAQLFTDDVLIDESAPYVMIEAATDADDIKAVRLPRGQFFVRVVPVAVTPSLYTLSLTAEPFDHTAPKMDPGDNSGTALDVGVLSALQQFGGSVGPGDDEDYYRFELTSSATVTYSLTDVLGRATAQVFLDADLINESNPHDMFDAATGDDRTRELDLSAGVYYIRVVPIGVQHSFYRLSLFAETD